MLRIGKHLSVLVLFVGLLSGLPAQTWIQRTASVVPAARSGHSMVYDVSRNVTVLFGGTRQDGVELGDTWEWNGFGWLVRQSQIAPQPRTGHGLAYDSTRRQVVMFGGRLASGACSDETWIWNGVAWTSIASAQGPQPRESFGIAFDSWRSRVVVFGGRSAGGSVLGDTWSFDGLTWTQDLSAGPSPRSGMALTFDDRLGRVVAFGGDVGGQVSAETWVMDANGWQLLSPSASPLPRTGALLTFDRLCGEAVLQGGVAAGLQAALPETWIWNGGQWLQSAAVQPPARLDGALSFNPQSGTCFLWGGRSNGQVLDDGWELASSCRRSMTLVNGPRLGQEAVFQYDYPTTAAGHLFVDLVTANYMGSYPVPIPGFDSLGVARVDLNNVLLSSRGLLDASGAHRLRFFVPVDPYLVGLPFDVQSVDLTLLPQAVYWASNDLEVAVSPQLPPVPSFWGEVFVPSTQSTMPVLILRDNSANGPTSWAWDFGDDGTVERNSCWTTVGVPAGTTVRVRFTVTNTSGTASIVRCLRAQNWFFSISNCPP